jgi:hypothetical protein
MLKSIPVIIYKLVIIIGIHKKVIAGAENIGGTDIGFRQVNLRWLSDFKYVSRIVIQVFPLLVSQVGGCFFIPDNSDRIIDPDGSMIGGYYQFVIHG